MLIFYFSSSILQLIFCLFAINSLARPAEPLCGVMLACPSPLWSLKPASPKGRPAHSAPLRPVLEQSESSPSRAACPDRSAPVRPLRDGFLERACLCPICPTAGLGSPCPPHVTASDTGPFLMCVRPEQVESSLKVRFSSRLFVEAGAEQSVPQNGRN